MIRRLLPLIFSVLCAVTTAGAASPNEPVKLVCKFAQGDVSRIKISQHTAGARTMSGTSKPVPVDIDMTSVVQMLCTHVLENGDAEMAVKTESATLKLSGRQSDYPQAAETRNIVHTPSGRISPGSPKQAAADRRRPLLDLNSVESILMLAPLPDKPISIGDTWTAEVPLPVGPTAKLSLSLTLNDIKDLAGDRVAAIRVNISTPVAPDTGTDTQSARGSQEGTADLVFSLEKGALISAKGSIHSVLTTYTALPKTPTVGPNPPAQYSVSTWKLDSKFDLLRLSAMPYTGTQPVH